MDRAFESCNSLVDASMTVPDNVTDMSYTFISCSALEVLPNLSNCTKLTNMYCTFNGCTSLTGTIAINANPTEYGSCFSDIDFEAQNITLTGSSTMLDEIGSTGLNYCTDCNGKCQSNH